MFTQVLEVARKVEEALQGCGTSFASLLLKAAGVDGEGSAQGDEI